MSEIVESLLQYLSSHPGAGDTLEGIARFWIAQQRVDAMVDDVQKALDDLCSQHVLRKSPIRSARGDIVDYIYELDPSQKQKSPKIVPKPHKER